MGVYLSEVLSGRKNAEIGAVLGIAIDAVTNAAGRTEERREEDRKFKSEILRIKRIVRGSLALPPSSTLVEKRVYSRRG